MNTRMKVVLPAVALAGALGVAVGVATVSLRSDGGAEADSGVRITGNEARLEQDEALADASGQAGFEVVLPSTMPDGFEFVSIAVSKAPEGQVTALPYVTQTFVREAPAGQITLAQYPVRLDYPANDDTSNPIDAAGTRFEVHRTGSDGSVVYTARDASRTFVLHFFGVFDVTDDQALAIIRSIPGT